MKNKSNKNTIIYFTKYSFDGPSSRYRSYYYFPHLEEEYNIKFYPFFPNKYINLLNNKSSLIYILVFYSYLIRLFQYLYFLFNSQKIFFIEYELFPYFPPFFEKIYFKTGKVLYFDYDDAIFHKYDSKNIFSKFFLKNKFKQISKYSKKIIVGNEYLNSYFLSNNAKTLVLPTSVPFYRYTNSFKLEKKEKNILIGWLGSNSSSKNLLSLFEVFKEVKKNYSQVNFVFMGVDSKYFSLFNSINIELLEWDEESEIQFLDQIDIGIMPLDDDNFNKGKCGFKLIQYMAKGVITISTPTKSNKDINIYNQNYHATSIKEWYDTLEYVIKNIELIKNKVSLNNIKLVKTHYSIESNVEKLKKMFSE